MYEAIVTRGRQLGRLPHTITQQQTRVLGHRCWRLCSRRLQSVSLNNTVYMLFMMHGNNPQTTR